MSKKQRQDPEVNGLYKINQSNQKRDNQATKHAFKTVGITSVLIVVLFFGYQFASGQSLNPFHSAIPRTTQQSSSQAKPKQQSSSNSQKIEEQVKQKAMVAETIANFYDGMNHLANGYGDTNQVKKPLATYFVNGRKNDSYRSNYRWTDNQLGNYHTRTVTLTPVNFDVNGDIVSYEVKSDYVLARGKHSKNTTKWIAELKMVDGHYQIIRMMARK